jgi:pyruvate formate lyase activating enzyme
MQEARYYQLETEGQVAHCRLCPHSCRIAPEQVGRCRVRRNVGGKLYPLNYGAVTSCALDPIEKKPLYHFHPGSSILSVGTYGCNFHCTFCQNWEISQGDPKWRYFSPAELVRLAVQERERSGAIGIAYTYSEPLVWYEYVWDTARLAREAGLVNVLVTNGFVQQEPLRELLPLIDALNIDVKAFKGEYYNSVCNGRLEPVLETVATASRLSHVELTTLLVPTKNDSEEEVVALVNWIADLDRSIPLHLSRYFPQFKMDLPPTPLETLRRAREIALKKLQFVYIGNAPELTADDTLCPNCQQLLVERQGYSTRVTGLNGKYCSHCGEQINIIL